MGSARSGTSWLAKAFDSHPDVIYRHEPDLVFPGEGPPRASNAEDFDRFAQEAAAFFQKMASARTLRSVGSLPVFRKSYHSGSQHLLRLSIIGALRAIGKSGLAGRNGVRNIKIPDFVDLASPRVRMMVIKSIDFVDRAGLFARAVPDLRVILLVRDPRSVVASRLRGFRAGKFATDQPWEGLVQLAPAKRRGLTIEQFRGLPRAVQSAWDWLTENETAIESIARCGNVRIVRFREMVDAPEPTVRQLFDFAGLSWAAQTGKFLYASRSDNNRGRYYGVYREKDYKRRADRWEDVISPQEAQQICDLIKDSPAGQLFM
ncbi:MAG: sulfotransferase [Stellaceae bacterium]